MAAFEKVRVSLDRDEPGPALLASGHKEVHRPRRDFLAAAFHGELSFHHGRSLFKFLPIPAPDGYAGGLFIRARPIRAKHSNLEPYTAENFESSLFIMSIEKDQIGWMQINQKVGAGKAILEDFFLHLIKKTHINDWHPLVRYMDSRGEYLTVIREHKSEIASLKFTFIPPNALGGDDTARKFVKLVNDTAHPDTQQHLYRAPPGKMDPEAPVLIESAEIAMQGGGSAEVRDARNRILYSSDRARTVEAVADEELPTPAQPDFIRRVIMRLFNRSEGWER